MQLHNCYFLNLHLNLFIVKNLQPQFDLPVKKETVFADQWDAGSIANHQ